jgi:hypothetical protein
MNNNLEFENEDPTPDSVENNHPRTNYGEEFTKQKTVEEAAENHHNIFTKDLSFAETRRDSFIEGAKWQAERMYSEEEVLNILYKHTEDLLAGKKVTLEEWFEQFKKKT